MRNIIAFTGWELVYQGVACESALEKLYEVKLTFTTIDKKPLSRTLPVLALSPHYIMTPECVIRRKNGETKSLDTADINFNYLTYQEFLNDIDRS